jgi:urease accessory protein UreE
MFVNGPGDLSSARESCVVERSVMVVVTEARRQVEPVALSGKERDTLRLTWEERRWTRRRAVTAAGREVALALPTGSVLRAGDIIAVEPAWYLAVEARPEPVLAVFPRDRSEAVRVAFDVGNRHFSLALDGDILLVPDDTAMEQLLVRLGVAWERREAVYDPIDGGGHRHEPGTSPLDGHPQAHGQPADD